MGTQHGEEEIHLLERVKRHQEDYRRDRAIAISEERERRHMEGNVYVAGVWVSKEDVALVDRGLRRHERLVLFETLFFVFVLSLFVYLTWIVFGFLLLP